MADNSAVYLKNIVDNLPHFIFWKDRESRFLGCNLFFANSAGFSSPAQIIGKSDYDMPWKDKAAQYIKDDQMIMTKCEPLIGVEEEQPQRDGSIAIMLVSKVPMFNEKHDVIGLLCIYMDITARKQMERNLAEAKERAEAANKAKTEFIANISHDFVTALTSILGLTQILKEKDLDRSTILSYLNDMEKSGNNLLQLINDIITFTKSDHGVESVRKDIIDFSKMAEDIYAMLHHKAEQKDLEFQITVNNEQQKIISDKNRLTRIMMNLAGNAIKFTDSGKVSVKIIIENKTNKRVLLHIEVKDTGIGIPIDKQADIFERFSRIDPSYKGHESGAGLGLSIVKRFVEDLQGTIILDSYPDKGTTFIVDIPCILVDSSSSVSPDPPVALEPVVKHSANVLLVEDNPIVQKVTAQFLKDLGCHVTCAGTANEALLKFNEMHDLVLLDIGLPDHDGLYVVREIRKFSNAKLKKIPVVAHTAHLKDEDRQQALDAGMDDFLTKPTNKVILSQMLSRFVPKAKGS